MMAASQAGWFNFQALTNQGDLADGYRLRTYAPGTTTQKTAYTDAAGAISHTYTSDGVGGLYIALNERAELPAPLFLSLGGYDILLQTAAGATVWSRRAYGQDDSAATLDTALRADISSTSDVEKGDALIGVKSTLTGATARTQHAKNADTVSVKDFGAVGDGVADDTAALQAAVNSLKPIHIPSGTYKFSALTGLAQQGLTIFGDGSANTVLKHAGSGIALDIDGSIGGVFIQNQTLQGFTIEGNTNTTNLIRTRKYARSRWTDINGRELNAAAGIAFLMQGTMLSKFTRLMCSQDLQAMTLPPTEGLRLEATGADGNCANNNFDSCYFEGAGAVASSIGVGIRITGGTQNKFTGGSPESCKTYGLLIGANCNYNTFENVGFENLGATGGDLSDGGNYTRFTNCYSSEKVIFQGRSAVVEGGVYERVQIDAGALKTRVQDIAVNGWATGSGGFFDAGTGTSWRGLWDIDLAAFIYPLKDRVGLTIGASPHVHTNTTGEWQKIVLNGGTISAITQTRNANSYSVPAASPTVHLVGPGESLTITYSVSPTLAWEIPLNGIES